MSDTRKTIYSLGHRVWHWVQAGGISVLVITGVLIHWPGWAPGIDFRLAVLLHDSVGLLVVANAMVGLLYYVVAGQFKHLVPRKAGFLQSARRQMNYYAKGIFRGETPPKHASSDHRLNPLQQVTYLAILNGLLPLQIVTGLLIWSAGKWPEVIAIPGGLVWLAIAHTLGAWAFVAFGVAHVYLATTGHTPTAHVKKMVLGYEERRE